MSKQLEASFAAQDSAIARMNALADAKRSEKRTKARTKNIKEELEATVYAQPQTYVMGVHKGVEGVGTAGSRRKRRKGTVKRKTRSRRRR